MGLRKDFEDVRSQYGLPNWEHLDWYFEISTTEYNDFFPLRCIRRKMIEKLVSTCDRLALVLHPEQDLASIYDNMHLSDSIRKEIFAVYKRLMVLIRKSGFYEMEGNNEGEAHLITEISRTWDETKEDLRKFFLLMEQSWKIEEEKNGKVKYLG